MVGYVTTFDDPYPVGRGLREVIKRDTFDLSKPVPLFFEHDWKAGPVGVSRSLTTDSLGIKAEFELFVEDDQRARSIYRAMKAGALEEFSIGFLPAPGPDSISRSRSGDVTTETIKKGELLEVSSVVRGANPSTETVSVRAVPPMPAAIPGAPPAPGAPLDPSIMDDKPTKAGLVTKAAELVEMAIELHMADQLPDVIKQAMKILVEAAPAAPAVPNDPNAVPAAPPAAPPAPPQRSDFAMTDSLRQALTRVF